MLASVALAAGIAAFSLSPGSDTTLVVPKGLDLDVANYSGEVLIDAWSKSAIRIRTEHADQDKVLVSSMDHGLLIKAYSKHMADRGAEIRLTVPAWMNLDISGIHTDVVIAGTEGQVRVETVHGDVVVKGGRRSIDLATVNQDICLSDASGTVAAETVNGDAYLWRIDADSVSVSTVNGEIAYEGTIKDEGAYRFASHNGDIALGIPRDAKAAVAVSTFSGEFESNFPVTLTEARGGKRFQFCVGGCSARVELESFQGTIQIYKAGPSPSEKIQNIDRIAERIYSKYLYRKWDKAVERAHKHGQKSKQRQGEEDEGEGEEGGEDEDE
jgi:hypothetical protein